MICDIHRRFLEAGADIIETNTFGATSITQSEFFVDDPREHGGRKDPAFYQKIIDDKFLGDLAWEINEQSARQCREWADRVANADGRQRFVAGAIGPLTVSLSNSPDADDAGFRVVTFDQVKTAYMQQMRALIAGGSDLLLVETIFDSLNAKAALVAIREVFDAGRHRAADHDLGSGGARRRDDDLRADHRSVLERGQAREAALGRAQLLARPGPDVPVPLGPLGEVELGDLVLSERRVAQPALVDRLRSGAAGHGPLTSASSPTAAWSTSPAAAAATRPSTSRPSPRRSREGRPARIADEEVQRPDKITPEIADRSPPLAPLRLAAVHPAARRLHDDRRAHQRRRLAEVRQADQGGQVRGGRERRAAAGRERRERHRYLHGRRHDRRRRGDDALPALARAASPRSPRCRSWSTPRNGRSSRPASSACRARAS